MATTLLAAVYVAYLLIASIALIEWPGRSESWGWLVTVAALAVPGVGLAVWRVRAAGTRLTVVLLVVAIPGGCGIDLWMTAPPTVDELRRIVLDVPLPALELTDEGGRWSSCFLVSCTDWSGDFCAEPGRAIELWTLVEPFRSARVELEANDLGTRWYGTHVPTGADVTLDDSSHGDRACAWVTIEGERPPGWLGDEWP